MQYKQQYMVPYLPPAQVLRNLSNSSSYWPITPLLVFLTSPIKNGMRLMAIEQLSKTLLRWDTSINRCHSVWSLPPPIDFHLGNPKQRPQTLIMQVRVFVCLPCVASPTNLLLWWEVSSMKYWKLCWILCLGKLNLMLTQSSMGYILLFWNILFQILMLEVSSASGIIKQHRENFASRIHLNIDLFMWTDVCLHPAQCVIRLEILQ